MTPEEKLTQYVEREQFMLEYNASEDEKELTTKKNKNNVREQQQQQFSDYKRAKRNRRITNLHS
jgi:hypothetical protein